MRVFFQLWYTHSRHNVYPQTLAAYQDRNDYINK